MKRDGGTGFSRRKVMAVALLLAVTLVLVAAGPGALAAPKQTRVMIGFREESDRAGIEAVMEAIAKAGGETIHSYGIVPAVAAYLPQAAIEALRKNPNVSYVEEDVLVYTSAQTVPWGITRVDALTAHSGGNYGGGIKVAIIDTGISPTHEDLTVVGGATFVSGTTTWHDDHGHGTHVAGTVAALNNNVGVIGAAPAVALYAVKVLSSTGSGYVSDVVAGIDWCRTNGMQIINMSLGASSGAVTLAGACNNAYAAGIVVVAAAGNRGIASGTGDNVGYPAKYDSVIAVAATDQSDVRASFSSTGPAVELAAPGVSIHSTVRTGGYGNLSGTSMAAPHVAGVAALVLKANPIFTNIDVRNAMASTAVDLGDPGRDPWYGYGLVQAPTTPQLVVTVATRSHSYVKRWWPTFVRSTTTVTDGQGAPVAGASVQVAVHRPNNTICRSSSGTTNTSGVYRYNFWLWRFGNPAGVYTVRSGASETGYTSGFGATTFTYE